MKKLLFLNFNMYINFSWLWPRAKRRMKEENNARK